MSTDLQIKSLSDLEKYGKIFNDSKLFPNIHQEAQAMVKIMAGAAFGLDPFSAMSNINIVSGKPQVSAVALAGKIRGSGRYDFKILVHTEEECQIEFFKGSESLGISDFTMKEATRAGLSTRQNKDGSDNLWKKYPKNMLFSRCISNGVKWFCPDVFAGVIYSEADSFDENLIEIKADKETQSKSEIKHIEAKKDDIPISEANPELDIMKKACKEKDALSLLALRTTTLNKKRSQACEELFCDIVLYDFAVDLLDEGEQMEYSALWGDYFDHTQYTRSDHWEKLEIFFGMERTEGKELLSFEKAKSLLTIRESTKQAIEEDQQ